MISKSHTMVLRSHQICGNGVSEKDAVIIEYDYDRERTVHLIQGEATIALSNEQTVNVAEILAMLTRTLK